MAPSRTYLVSYPKSGNTWCRFLFANTLCAPGERIDFNTVVRIVPEWEQRSLDLAAAAKARVFKSHARYSPEFERVIYIVRDPRAAYLSYFRFFRKHLADYDTVASIASTPGKLAFGSWSDHVLGWYGRPGVRFYKYEELARDAKAVLSSMLEYAQIESSADRIDLAIANSSFDSMKRLEDAFGRPFLDEQSRLKASPFMRVGSARSWESELAEADQRAVEDKHAQAMALLGYL